jgi:hypothetical protein
MALFHMSGIRVHVDDRFSGAIYRYQNKAKKNTTIW